MLNDIQDAYGHLLWDYHNGEENVEITDIAKIIAETLNPYQTEESCHLAYHQFNRDRGRMSGQLRLRIRYPFFGVKTPCFSWGM